MNFNLKSNYNNHSLKFILLISSLIIMLSCDSKPKVIEQTQAITPRSQDNVGIAQNNESHTVRINEVLQSDRYTYMSVNEEKNNYWVAVARQNIEVGEDYIFEGGLLKKNFESKEFNRVFETIYLVSKITKANAEASDSALDRAYAELRKIENSAVNTPNPQAKISGETVSLSDIFNNPTKYGGKNITVEGQCVKVNNQIMGKNWIHIQDVKNSPEIELTLTTLQNIEIGTKALFTGTIALNKDFGAGYKYDIIMENTTIQ